MRNAKQKKAEARYAPTKNWKECVLQNKQHKRHQQIEFIVHAHVENINTANPAKQKGDAR